MHTRAVSQQPPPGANDATVPTPLAVAPRAETVPAASHRRSPLGRMAEQEWAPGLLFFICDVVCWVAIYGLLSFLRHDAYFSSGFEFAVIDIIQVFVIVHSLFIIGGYSSRTEMRGLTYTAEHILAILAALAVSSLLIYTAATFDQTMKPSRSVIVASFIAFAPLSLVYRRAMRKRVAEASTNRAFLVIGVGELASNFYQAYRAAGNPQRLEFIDLQQKRVGEPIAGPGSPLIEGDLTSKLNEVSKRYSGIVLAESVDQIRPDVLDRLIRAQFQRTRVYTVESFYEAHWRHIPMYSIDPYWPLQTGFQLSRASPYHYLKRLFDVASSVVGLAVLWPLLAVIAALIWITNGRPVIFTQQRVGRDEGLFTLYKFRTMEEEAEVSGQRSAVSEDKIYTCKNDPRVLRLGWWLRKLRLDELPQLWNVFKGDMSLIGPRAEWVECVQRYERNIPLYHFRHLVKPGITGWAQVNYPYGESEQDAVEKLKYDLYYIRHYSLTLDAMIVLKTIHTMLFGKGR